MSRQLCTANVRTGLEEMVDFRKGKLNPSNQNSEKEASRVFTVISSCVYGIIVINFQNYLHGTVALHEIQYFDMEMNILVLFSNHHRVFQEIAFLAKFDFPRFSSRGCGGDSLIKI
jgi:hypothetical protein